MRSIDLYFGIGEVAEEEVSIGQINVRLFKSKESPSGMPTGWRFWTSEEEKFLRENYKKMFQTDIAKKLSRSLASVEHKCRVLKLKSGPRNRSAEIDFKGNKNPNWKGGLSTNFYRYKKIQMERFPERAEARLLVTKALEKGELVRPDSCSKCGKVCKPHAHHEDYSKPLEVVWVCRECHRQVHGGRH